MIKINLAGQVTSFGGGASAAGGAFAGGVETDGIFMSAEDVRKEAIKRLVIILLFPLGLYVYEMQTIPGLKARLNGLNQQILALQEYNLKATNSVAEIKKFKEDEAKIQSRIAVLEKLSKDRLREIRVLDLLQQVVPEKVWFTNVNIGNGKALISGYAMSDFEISAFMEALSKSIFLVDVNLLSSSEQSVEGTNLKKFELSCTLEKP